MTQHISDILAFLPDHPGVYLMKDEKGTVIYVGKAVSLKNRVRQYFHSGRHASPKVEAMVEQIADMETVLVDNELEAFILECNLIKKYEPYYNILLRDDKQYPYIKIDRSKPYPRVEVVRRMGRDKAKYFGPYFSQTAVRQALDSVGRIFPIRSCRRKLPEEIGKERPCLNYHIGRCLGPCTGKVTPEEYAAVVDEVCAFLQGRGEDAVKGLERMMQEAAGNLEFEKAALYRDRIEAIREALGSRQKAISTSREDMDIIGLHRDENRARVALMMIRAGVLQGSESFPLEYHGEEREEALLASFVEFYYGSNPTPPGLILVSHLPEEAESLACRLSELSGRKVSLRRPVRGEKLRLVEMAQENAASISRVKRQQEQREWDRTDGACRQLQEVLQLPQTPIRMECFDISNIQGTDSVASMVVTLHGKAARDQYRRFRIKTVEGANDFASMKEVVGRRFRHGLEEQAERRAAGKPMEGGRFSEFPDLVVIDGGPIQLEFALEAMKEAGITIPAVGLAEKLEEIYLPGEKEPIRLPHDTAALQLMQRIRDEAHRFAITYHRSLRGHRMLKSFLDEIPGIGPKRRTALLTAFVTKEAMLQAGEEGIAAVPGIPRDLAHKVYESLTKGGQEP